MSIFYKMLMFTEALCVYVNPLIYQIKNTFFNKVKKKNLKNNYRETIKGILKNPALPK